MVTEAHIKNRNNTMIQVKEFDDLSTLLREKGKRHRAAIVWPQDKATQRAVYEATRNRFIAPVLIGCKKEVEQQEHYRQIAAQCTFMDAGDADDAARQAVALIRAGEADLLMKGFINTDVLLHAILNKQNGLLLPDHVLTHIAVAEMAGYRKLIFFTDAAVIPYPTHEQRVQQVQYMATFCRLCGISRPKISLIHCSEKVDAKYFPFTPGYLEIKAKAANGEMGDCIVDGPLDLKTSCNRESMLVKDISSPIEGDADALIFPDIEAANLFYKTITLFCGASTAGILQGTIAPVVLPSRGDSWQSKYNSLALAAIGCR